jgi:hypothetical protein
MEKWRNRILLGLRVLGTLFCSVLAWKFYRIGYGYGVEAWSSARAFSFLKDWLPAVVGVAVGVVPGSDWDQKMKTRYRVAVVVVGFIYSAVLYRAQTLSDSESTKQLTVAVGTAVSQANDHSDKQFDKVTKGVEGVDQKLSDTTVSLTTDIQRTDDAIHETSDRLDSSIGRVGKPVPPERPKLAFSLWRDGLTQVEFPLESESLQPNADGTFNVQFVLKNVSPTVAEGIEVWVQVCDQCAFATEPNSFDSPKGGPAQIRHKVIQRLNSGAAILEGNVFDVKINDPAITTFPVLFKYTCTTCEGISQPKQFWITKAFGLKPVLPAPASVIQGLRR